MSTTTNEPVLRIIKAASCPSLSGKSMLTYQIGVDTQSAPFIRVLRNSSRGYFSKEWTRFSDIEEIWADRQSINSLTFQSLFKGKSVNTAGFLLAVLLDLQLVHVTEGNVRSYAKGTTDAFMADMKALIDTPVDLPNEPPLQQPNKKGTLKLKASGSKAVTPRVAVRE